MTLAVPKICFRSFFAANFDRCAFFASLLPPPAALGEQAANSITPANIRFGFANRSEIIILHKLAKINMKINIYYKNYKKIIKTY